jgi:hypothetical protein
MWLRSRGAARKAPRPISARRSSDRPAVPLAKIDSNFSELQVGIKELRYTGQEKPSPGFNIPFGDVNRSVHLYRDNYRAASLEIGPNRCLEMLSYPAPYKLHEQTDSV